jgi:PAS domain S-box-containing protein
VFDFVKRLFRDAPPGSGAINSADEPFRAAEASARETQRAEREDRHHREQWQVTLRSIGDAVIVTDTSGAVTFLNPTAQALTGWAPQEAAGQPLERVFHIVNEETRQVVENPVAKVLREGTVVGLANHTILVARDGREIPIDDSGAPIRGEDGAVAGVVLVFRDVTEARRAVATRLHLAAIVESTDDAILSTDLGGVILTWNQGAERLYGYTAAEAVGKPLSILAPTDHPDELIAMMARIRRGERIHHFETVRVCKDGRRIDVSLAVSPVAGAEGKVIGASKIARDITARKRGEAALRFLAEASKLLAELLDVPATLEKVAGLAVPQFADCCAVDMPERDGSLRRLAVIHVNPAKAELTRELYRRYPPDPAAPVGPWHVFRTGRSEVVPEIPDSLLVERARDEEMLRMLRELGQRSYLGVPLTARGQTLGVLTFVMAESGRRFDAADLRLAEDLAHRAAMAIENARLYSELKEADRRKDEFLAMLAHELRNPLAPIRNALHVMQMPGADAEAVERARQMTERQVKQMVRLVDDLLDVSRIMRGKIELRKEPVELASVIATAVETAQPMIDAQGQELIVSVPAEPIRLEADPARLTQVVGNLLHNAAKFSERSGRIWLTSERQGGEAVVRVRDEGAGIRPELLPHVFDLFVQEERSLERSRGGLGIGLTVVRKLVALHGGAIAAHSEGPGRGSEFVVRLPVLADSGGQPVAGAVRPSTRVAQRRRVLVVDDNVDAAESIGMLLRLWGHEVRLAHNGPQAIRAAAEQRPEVFVLDIGLPGMNGFEVARHLRQQSDFHNALFIAVTGYGQEEDRRRTEEAGFDHHLTKPVDPVALENLLRK